jgi:hypothetical protein
LDQLVDSGKSVIVIEHHLAVMAHADWIIDLGPGAGHDGGRIVFEGAPADLVADRSTLTGQHLAEYVGSAQSLSLGTRLTSGRSGLTPENPGMSAPIPGRGRWPSPPGPSTGGQTRIPTPG